MPFFYLFLTFITLAVGAYDYYINEYEFWYI